MIRGRLPGLVLVLAISPALAAAQTPAPARAPAPRPAAPPRDNAPPPPPQIGTAIVRGHITAAATGQPLYRVRVTMNGAAANSPTAVTDAQGAFEITGVLAGTYSIAAARAGYLTVQYGQRRPREAGRTLVVKNGDVIEEVDLALFAGAVLAGRILDDGGEPMQGVLVEVMDMQYARGRRMPLQSARAVTDDLGEFRVGGLEPGTYYLRASTMEMWHDEDAGKGTYAYARTFYPGVPGLDGAQTIGLATGQESVGLDFPLVRGRAVRITGTLLNASGDPIAAQVVSLDRIERTTGGALLSAGFGGTTRTDRGGHFELREIPPGEYRLYSTISQTESASVNSLIVTDVDIDDIILTPRRASSVQGTITTDDGTAPPFPPARVRVVPIPADEANVLPPWGTPTPQVAGGDWSFRFNNIDGPYLFRPNGLPDEWAVRAVQVNGRDVTDTPLNIPPGGVATTGVQMILTRHAGTVTGKVVTADGKPLADSTVVVFAADERRWGLGTRFVKSTRPDNAGHFSVRGLPAGPYFAIAKDFVVEGQWDDPEFLRLLARDASRVELSADGEQTVTLVLKPEEPR